MTEVEPTTEPKTEPITEADKVEDPNTTDSTTDTEEEEEKKEEEIPPYTLRDHCRHLQLRTETSENDTRSYWYCDWTRYFVTQHTFHSVPEEGNDYRQEQARQKQAATLALLKDTVKEYCQPFATLSQIQHDWVGILSCPSVSSSALSSTAIQDAALQDEDPLAVRTVTIRLRPDTPLHVIWEAVHEAFTSFHFPKYRILKSDLQTFQALAVDDSLCLGGASDIATNSRSDQDDTNHPILFFLSAHCATHKSTLQRRLWLRWYHVEDDAKVLTQWEATASTPTSFLTTDEMASTVTLRQRQALTPINQQLPEACALVKHVLEEQLTPAATCPGTDMEETTRYFQRQARRAQKSKSATSVYEENQNAGRHRNTTRLFPALSPPQDAEILQISSPLLDRVFSELELRQATYNTLVVESSRFGMRPNQATLDKEFCFQLAQISQQQMLMELQTELQQAETILHDSLSDMEQMEQLLMDVLRRKYNIPHTYKSDGHHSPMGMTQKSLEIGQTPISLTRRKLQDFPWHNAVQKALEDVSTSIANGCLQAFEEQVSVQMANDAVQHVLAAFGVADDMDQRQFLQKKNRQAMIRVRQGQSTLKRLLQTIILAPTDWPGLPKLTTAVKTWYEIAGHAKTSNLRRHPVPLLEFRTPLGQGCLTPQQLILLTTGLFQTKVNVLDLVDVDVQHTPHHKLTKVSVSENGQRVLGFTPLDTNIEALVNLIHVLKALQEA